MRNVFISGRVREVLLDGKWIANTNFKEQIESLTKEQATQRVANLNTIALLTFHINYYVKGVLNVLNGGELEIRDRFSFDMPDLNTEEDWRLLVNSFIQDAILFANKVAHMNDDTFDEIFADEKYGTKLRNIEALIEHAYYHLGQVSLLRKLIH